jgi:hypothetical protein
VGVIEGDEAYPTLALLTPEASRPRKVERHSRPSHQLEEPYHSVDYKHLFKSQLAPRRLRCFFSGRDLITRPPRSGGLERSVAHRVATLARSRGLGLDDCSQGGMLGLRRKFFNFGAGKSLVSSVFCFLHVSIKPNREITNRASP